MAGSSKGSKTMTNDEIIEGYRDGYADDRDELPASLANRSESYRHGWLNGRDDRLGRPRASAEAIRQRAREVEKIDTWTIQ
ncbi:hypothetical protein [Hyphomicrobium sp.]|uniref:hypothetical protein n=1 Tax=Hyphomicrobium sp. TaxID=82 RepID=UPI002FE2471B